MVKEMLDNQMVKMILRMAEDLFFDIPVLVQSAYDQSGSAVQYGPPFIAATLITATASGRDRPEDTMP